MKEALITIIEDSLKGKGYDGLCNPILECGCFIGDLCPCDNASLTMCLGGVRESSDEGDTCVLRVD